MLDGIVSHAPSILQVVVAVPDAERGAILRTVHRRTVTERDAAGPHDKTLRRVVARTPSTVRGGPGGGAGRGRRGYSRSAGHRTTGK